MFFLPSVVWTLLLGGYVEVASAGSSCRSVFPVMALKLPIVSLMGGDGTAESRLATKLNAKSDDVRVVDLSARSSKVKNITHHEVDVLGFALDPKTSSAPTVLLINPWFNLDGKLAKYLDLRFLSDSQRRKLRASSWEKQAKKVYDRMQKHLSGVLNKYGSGGTLSKRFPEEFRNLVHQWLSPYNVNTNAAICRDRLERLFISIEMARQVLSREPGAQILLVTEIASSVVAINRMAMMGGDRALPNEHYEQLVLAALSEGLGPEFRVEADPSVKELLWPRGLKLSNGPVGRGPAKGYRIVRER